MPATAIASPAPTKCRRSIPYLLFEILYRVFCLGMIFFGKPLHTFPDHALAQTVLALDFRNRQTAHARQRPTRVGDGDRNHDLVGARRVVDLHLHAVEMTAHEGRVLVPERNVERGA